jgi:hypothetical protein
VIEEVFVPSDEEEIDIITIIEQRKEEITEVEEHLFNSASTNDL